MRAYTQKDSLNFGLSFLYFQEYFCAKIIQKSNAREDKKFEDKNRFFNLSDAKFFVLIKYFILTARLKKMLFVFDTVFFCNFS